jgi:hypothetical protein
MTLASSAEVPAEDRLKARPKSAEAPAEGPAGGLAGLFLPV